MRRRFVVILLLTAVLPWTGTSLHADYVKGREAAIKLYWADKREEALAMFVGLAESSITDLQKADALDWASRTLQYLERVDEAMQHAEQIPIVSMRKTAQARVHIGKGRWQEVLNVFEGEDLSQWPPSVAAQAFAYRGSAHLRLEHGEAAVADYTHAAELIKEPNALAGVLLGLGRAHQVRGDSDAAVQAYQRVYTATHNVARHTDAAIAVAEIRMAQDSAGEAVAELNKVDLEKLQVPSLHVSLLMTGGRALTQQGQKAEAIASYRQAMEHDGASEAQKSACQAAIDALQAVGS